MKAETKLEKAKAFVKNIPDETKVTVAVVLALVGFVVVHVNKNDITRSSVMVLNAKKTGGGTGVILRSNEYGSEILTNAHVCRAIKAGGVVVNHQGEFMVESYKMSKEHDLCLLKVGANLKTSTSVAGGPPDAYYESAAISGHPSLLPNVITRGHFSGSAIIEVMEGIRKCTDDDLESGEGVLFCLFLGGIPIIKRFESTLVTATIMPGSSGSGVYNSSNELTGLAFAGTQGISYAWTVPYESLKRFLDVESHILAPEVPDNNVQIFDPKKQESDETEYAWQNNAFKTLRRKCHSEDLDERFTKYCQMVAMDSFWRK